MSKYTIEEINDLINNNKIDYFQEEFQDELEYKNFLGSFLHGIYSDSDSFMIIWFLTITLSGILPFLSLFFLPVILIPIFLLFYSILFFKHRNKVNFHNSVFEKNFKEIYFGEENLTNNINNKINKLSNKNKTLFKKFAKNENLSNSKVYISYSIMYDYVYYENIDGLKENQEIIFEYLRSPLFKKNSDYRKNYLLEKFEDRLKEQTFDEKIDLLKNKITPSVNETNKEEKSVIKNL